MMHSILMWKKTGSVFLFLLILLPYSIADDFSTSLPIEPSSDDSDSLLQQGGDPELFNHGFSLLSEGTENSGAGVDNCGDHSSVPADVHITNSSRKKRSALPFRQEKREETGAGESRVCNWQEKKGNTTPRTQVPSPRGTAQDDRSESPTTPLEPKEIDFGTDQNSWPSTIDLISPSDKFVATANERICPGQDNFPVCYYPFPSSARFPVLVASRSARRFMELTPCRGWLSQYPCIGQEELWCCHSVYKRLNKELGQAGSTETTEEIWLNIMFMQMALVYPLTGQFCTFVAGPPKRALTTPRSGY